VPAPTAYRLRISKQKRLVTWRVSIAGIYG
jgi:hypothetical protein